MTCRIFLPAAEMVAKAANGPKTLVVKSHGHAGDGEQGGEACGEAFHAPD